MTLLIGWYVCSVVLQQHLQPSAKNCSLSSEPQAAACLKSILSTCSREMGLTARIPELLDHGGNGKLSRQKAGNLMAALSTVKILLSLADGDQQVCNSRYRSL